MAHDPVPSFVCSLSHQYLLRCTCARVCRVRRRCEQAEGSTSFRMERRTTRVPAGNYVMSCANITVKTPVDTKVRTYGTQYGRTVRQEDSSACALGMGLGKDAGTPGGSS